MTKPQIVFLPGLDGNGFYLSALQGLLRDYADCVIMQYPCEIMDYNELCRWVLTQLDDKSGYIIIAESFGGPLGLKLAYALQARAKALILSSTFAKPPLPRLILKIAAAVYPHIIHYDFAVAIVNFFLCNGRNAPLARQLHKVMLETGDMVMANRIRILADLDATDTVRQLTLPCLILQPRCDTLIWFSNFTALRNKSVIRIAGPHGLMATEPQAAYDAISDFIKHLN